MREEVLGIAVRTDSGGLDLIHAGCFERPSGNRRQIQVVAFEEFFPDPGEGVSHLVSDLETAGTDPRTDGRRFATDPRYGVRHQRTGESAPAAVEHREATGSRHGDRKTVGRENQKRQTGDRGDVAVGLGWLLRWIEEMAFTVVHVFEDPGTVDLKSHA